MSQTRFFDQFLERYPENGRTRMFGSEEGLRLATLPTPFALVIERYTGVRLMP